MSLKDSDWYLLYVMEMSSSSVLCLRPTFHFHIYKCFAGCFLKIKTNLFLFETRLGSPMSRQGRKESCAHLSLPFLPEPGSFYILLDRLTILLQTPFLKPSPMFHPPQPILRLSAVKKNLGQTSDCLPPSPLLPLPRPSSQK